MHKGIATFTLDDGRCPRWLFERMVKLGREMVRALVYEFGPDEFVRRIGDPVWFQSLGTVLAFDWNASGLTTILTAALKEAIRREERTLGIFICGGKGKTSRKTPEEIILNAERADLTRTDADKLVYNSKMAAKVDSSLVQDGYQLYHHAFFFSRSGAWAVVQQGMNQENGTARRYHWQSDSVKDLVREPHSGIFAQASAETLNLVAAESERTRGLSVELVNQPYAGLMKDVEILRRHSSRLSQTVTLGNRPAFAPPPPGGFGGTRKATAGKQGDLLTLLNLERREYHTHPVVKEDFGKSKYLDRILAKLASDKPENYEKVLATRGVGPKTMRALSLVGEVIYGAKPSYEDPARYGFAFGGKDETPYPVDRPTYDEAIRILTRAVQRTRLEQAEKRRMLQRLGKTAFPA